jgi:hypothetical protein
MGHGRTCVESTGWLRASSLLSLRLGGGDLSRPAGGRLARLLHGRRGPGAIKDRLARDVQAQDQVEGPVRGPQPVRILARTQRIILQLGAATEGMPATWSRAFG